MPDARAELLKRDGFTLNQSVSVFTYLSPCGRGRIASLDAIRVRGYGLTIDLNPSPQPSPKGRGSAPPLPLQIKLISSCSSQEAPVRVDRNSSAQSGEEGAGEAGDGAWAVVISLSSPHRKLGTISSAIRIASALASRPRSTATTAATQEVRSRLSL